MAKPKIFCIGFHKTGTKSLAVALRMLGYTVTGPNGVYDPDISKHVYSMAFELVARFDAFQDNPWPVIYKELDREYPGSKFVLSVRNSDHWIKSQVRHFGISETPMRKWIYGVGCPQGHEEIYVRRFEAHNQEVLGYFQHRQSDLLVINLADGDGWEKLCPFLDQEVPNAPFPHANTAEERERDRARTNG